MLKKILVLIIACVTLSTIGMDENAKKFFEAVQNDDITAIQNLVKGGVNINQQDKDGNTALMIAIQKGKNKTAQELINMGANITNLINNAEQTALMLAINRKNLEMVKILLNSTDFMDIDYSKDLKGNTVLMLAVQTGDANIVEALLTEVPDPSSALDLANKIVDPDAKNKIMKLLGQAKKQFDLFKAIESGKLADVKAAMSPELLRSNIQSKKNPLFAAIKAGNLDIVKYLVAEGLKVDKNFVNQKIRSGITPLITSVRGLISSGFEISKFLLESGADPNIYVISPGIIPIFEVVVQDDAPKWVELLVKYGADINFQMPRGDKETPLIFAIRDCRFAVAKKLLEVGANPLLKNSAGKNALDVAKESKGFCLNPMIPGFLEQNKNYDELIKLLNEKEAIFKKAKPTIPVSQALISALQKLKQTLQALQVKIEGK